MNKYNFFYIHILIISYIKHFVCTTVGHLLTLNRKRKAPAWMPYIINFGFADDYVPKIKSS